MSEQKFSVPTEMIDLPSRGKVYPKESPLASGQVEMKYMTAREEDILTNVNLLRQGLAIEKMLKSLIKSPITYDDLVIGDRNGLLIAARILAYGKDYSFEYLDPTTGEKEKVSIDLQTLNYKEIDWSKLTDKNEFFFELPYTKNTVTFKILTLADDKKIEEEIKGIKKNLGQEAGALTTRLKYQITSVNGDYSVKTVRDFIDQGHLLSRDSIQLRRFMESVTPDVNLTTTFTTSSGREVEIEVPITADFFFPGTED